MTHYDRYGNLTKGNPFRLKKRKHPYPRYKAWCRFQQPITPSSVMDRWWKKKK